MCEVMQNKVLCCDFIFVDLEKHIYENCLDLYSSELECIFKNKI